MSAFFSKLSLLFCLKSQKMRHLHCVVTFQLWKLGCALTWHENAIPLGTKVRLRFDSARKRQELRCALTESKSWLQKLRCASEVKKIELRILRCAFTVSKDRCAFDIILFFPTSAFYLQMWPIPVKTLGRPVLYIPPRFNFSSFQHRFMKRDKQKHII